MQITASVDVHQSYRASTFHVLSSLAGGPVFSFHLPITVMIIDAFYARDRLLPTAAAILHVVGMQTRAEFNVL